MKEATIELASLISPLNLRCQEISIEEYVQLAREEIVEYNVAELVDLAWGKNLNEESVEGINMDG
jgi:hypothetical protein